MQRSDRDEEFTAFVIGSRDRLARLAMLLTNHAGTAEDLLQDALLKTYLAWSRVEPGMGVAFTRRVMVNLATDRWRRRSTRAVGDEATGWIPSRSAQQAFDAVDDRSDITAQLAALHPRERAMLVLRYYADLSEKQVADELGVSVGTVKSTCSRALARLRPGAPSMREGV